MLVRGPRIRITLLGLALVLVGWAPSLSIGLWTMSGPTLTLTALTLAALLVVLSARIAMPVPAAWVGVVLGLFAAWLANGLWSALADLGESGSISRSATSDRS